MEETIYKKSIWKRIFTKKKIIIYAIIILIIGFFIYKSKNSTTSNVQTDTVKKTDIKRTILSTGQVTSQTDLSLSFKASGIVSNVKVNVGDAVKSGDVLASLDQKDQVAALNQAKGTMAQAQANYQKVLDGASTEDIGVSEVALNNAKTALENSKIQQNILVKNAYSALLNSGLTAVPQSGNTSSAVPTVSGTYIGADQGQYKITTYNTGSGLNFAYTGLETGNGLVSNNPVPLGTRGLFIQFSSTSNFYNDSWIINIPNSQSASYVANYNAYTAAQETQKTTIASAESAVATAQAALDLKKAKARPADLQVAQAQIQSAQAQVDAAQANLENGIIRAPASGTITSVDIKIGELATALKEAVILQDVKNLHVESNISEASIALVKVGQPVEITFDALGLDRKFTGTIQQVNPASTVISGVVNYKVTVGLENLPEIKPGMTANLNVLVSQKQGVLAIPQRAIINQTDKKVVRVITDTKTKKYEERTVETGLEADGGLTEVVSGLNVGQEIVTLIKQ